MSRCGLVVEERGLYRPAFAIFTREDQELLRPVIDELVGVTVRVVERWLPRVRATINGITIVGRGLWFPDLEYIVVGALAPDYLGLDVLSREGLLVKAKRMPGGGEYVFAGFEAGGMSLGEAWVWGHHSVFGRYWFNTHGKLPPRGWRLALPDLAWLWRAQGVEPGRVRSRMVEIGGILSALLERDLGFRELQRLLGVDELDLALDLSLLLAIGYVRSLDDELWRLNIPVFSPKDYKEAKRIAGLMLGDIAVEFKGRLHVVREVYA